MNKKLKHPAFSLMEILLGTVMFAIFTLGVFYLSVDSLDTNLKQELENESLRYAQEGLEAARSIGNNDFLDLDAGNYGLSFSGTAWAFVSAPETIDTYYERTITVEDVYRDSNGDIASSGTLDPSIKKITSTVDWTWKGFLPETVYLTTYLSNWESSQWMQTTCTNFNSGTHSSTTTQAASAPPPDNCILTLDIVEEESEFLVGVDVGEHGNDVAVGGTYAYLATAKSAEGLAVIDIADTSNPTVITTLDIGGKGRYILRNENYLYIGVENSSRGLAIVDISNPLAPVLSSRTDVGTYGNQMAISGNYLYLGTESTSSSFRIYDISNPTSPSLVSSLNVGSKTLSVQQSGNYAYIGLGSSSAGFKVINISNPAAPSLTSTLNVGSSVNGISLNGSTAYLGLGRATNSLAVVNISNPTSPSLSTSLDTGGEIQDLGYVNNYLYLALDVVDPGLAAVNISQPSSPYLAFTLNVEGKGTGVTVDNDNIYISIDTANVGLVLLGAAGQGVASNGNYTSAVFDTGSTDTRYNFIEWEATEVSGSTIRFQIRTSSTSSNITTATFVGPDGTSSTYFETSPGIITLDPLRTGQQYVQVRAYMTSDGFNAPGLDYFKIDYNP